MTRWLPMKISPGRRGAHGSRKEGLPLNLAQSTLFNRPVEGCREVAVTDHFAAGRRTFAGIFQRYGTRGLCSNAKAKASVDGRKKEMSTIHRATLRGHGRQDKAVVKLVKPKTSCNAAVSTHRACDQRRRGSRKEKTASARSLRSAASDEGPAALTGSWLCAL